MASGCSGDSFSTNWRNRGSTLSLSTSGIHQRRPATIVGSIILMSGLDRKNGPVRIATRCFGETSTQPETSVTKGFALSNGGWKISGLPSDCVTYQTGRNSGDSSFYYGRDGYSRPEVRFYARINERGPVPSKPVTSVMGSSLGKPAQLDRCGPEDRPSGTVVSGGPS